MKIGYIQLLLFSLCIGMKITSTQGEAEKPFIDVSALSPAFEVFRRVETRSVLLLPSQSFPQGGTGLKSFLEKTEAFRSDSVFLSAALPGFRKNLVEWADTNRNHSLFVSPSLDLSGYTGNWNDTSRASTLFGFGGTLYGALARGISFYSHAVVYTEMTNRAQFSHQFNPQFGETYSVEKGAGDSLLKDRTYNRFESYLIADMPWLTLKAGRDHIHIGPGYFSSLMATRDTPPYYLVLARVDFAPWLSIDDNVIKMTDTQHDILKYANLHRFEFKPTNSLSLAFQDIVIYQDRDPDLRYILPLAPLMFTEADMGGPDNSAMGFDFLYCGLRNVSVWGELFIDDLMGPTSFFNDFWENRWAGLAGFQVTSPFPKVDADLVVEFSQVEPWTYNGRKPQTSFKHFNVASASKLGPDSRSWDFQFAYRPVSWIEIKEHAEFNDKGLGRSGILGVIHDDLVDGLTKDLLDGPVRADRILTTEVELHWKQYCRIGLSYSQNFGDSTSNRLEASLQLFY